MMGLPSIKPAGEAPKPKPTQTKYGQPIGNTRKGIVGGEAKIEHGAPGTRKERRAQEVPGRGRVRRRGSL